MYSNPSSLEPVTSILLHIAPVQRKNINNNNNNVDANVTLYNLIHVSLDVGEIPKKPMVGSVFIIIIIIIIVMNTYLL